MSIFSRVFLCVFWLTVMSAILAAAVGALDGFVPIPHAQTLISAFLESFKAGLVGMLGLLGGRTLTSRRR
jgi:hypothetical protein